MTMDPQSFIWIVFALCLAASFLLSGMEAGVFALSRLRVRQQMRAGKSSAKLLHGFLEHPENFLWTILVGNTVANFFVLGWLIAVFHQQALAGHPYWLAALYAFTVFFFYAFFDLLPKMLFRMFPNRLCMYLARPFQAIHFVLRPLVNLVETASGVMLRWRGGRTFTGRLFGNREELRLVMQESAQGLTSEERTMINRVLDLQALTVRQAMKPMTQVADLNIQAPVSEALKLCRDRGFTRMPVWEERESRRRVVGLIACNALLYQADLDPAKPVSDFLRPALYLDEDLRLEIALQRLQRSGQSMAIVLGRDRREIGILTLQDLLKVVFGQVSL